MGWLRILLRVKDLECQLAMEIERPKANENKSTLLGDRKQFLEDSGSRKLHKQIGARGRFIWRTVDRWMGRQQK